jgi:hypothetical protein
MGLSNDADIVSAISRWAAGARGTAVWDEIGWTELEWREWTSTGVRPRRLMTNNPVAKMFEGEVNIHFVGEAMDEEAFSKKLNCFIEDSEVDYGFHTTVLSVDVREIEQGLI